MYYLSIDPGAKTTGWASFDENGDSLRMGKIEGQNEFLDWLEEQDPKEVIYEVYRTRGMGRGNMMSTNQTSKLIGNIERICHKKKIPMHKSEASNLGIGLRYLGLYATWGGPKTPHCPDDVSALAHGVYILTKLKVRKHRLDTKG